MGPLGQPLVDDLHGFLASGRRRRVLDALAREQTAGALLGLHGHRESGHASPLRLGEIGDPAALRRVGDVVIAILGRRHVPCRGGREPDWLLTLLREAHGTPTAGREGAGHLSLGVIAAACHSDGDDERRLIDDLAGEMGDVVVPLVGLADLLERHPDAVTAYLDVSGTRVIRTRLCRLRDTGASASASLARLVELACDPRLLVQHPARTILEAHWPDALDKLRELAASPAPLVRMEALSLLHLHGGDGERAFLEGRLESESEAPVAGELDRLLGRSEADPARGELLHLPERERLAPPGPLTDAQRAALRTLADELTRIRATESPTLETEPPDVDAIVEGLECPRPWDAPPERRLTSAPWSHRDRLLRVCIRTARWPLIHLVRLLHHFHYWGPLSDWTRPHLTHARSAHGEPWELRDVDDAGTWAGLAPGEFALARVELIRADWYSWGPAATWPLYMEQLGLLAHALQSGQPARVAWLREPVDVALAALATFPRLPRAVVPTLWEFAFGPGSLLRDRTQRLLDAEPDVVVRVSKALQARKHEHRAIAARWLARLKNPAAIPALERAIGKERTDTAKAEMLTALAAHGCELSAYDNPAARLDDAVRGLRRVPKAMQPLMDLVLPTVRWEDSGAVVDQRIVRWWLLKAAKRGDPAPDALLEMQIAQLDTNDALALGDAVISVWCLGSIVNSSREFRIPKDEVLEHIPARYQHRIHELVPALPASGWPPVMAHPLTSPIKVKGILGIVAACGGPGPADHAEEFLRTWYGWFSAQCKALLRMLAFTEHPTATQVLLSTAARFRTAGIRDAADTELHGLAERRGWTPAELADRTIPSGELDSNGEHRLAYVASGSASPDEAPSPTRSFVVTVNDALKVELLDDSGGPISKLPVVRPGECEDGANQAEKERKRVARAIRGVVKHQKTRLYQAMCAERVWDEPTWRTYLLAHPIVGRMCRHLVWRVEVGTEGSSVPAFVAADGSFFGTDDLPLDGPVTRISLAHTAVLSETERSACMTAVQKLSLRPPLQQFPTHFAEVGDEAEWEAAIASIEGFVVPIKKLHTLATRRGYQRGPADEGAGFFSTYAKQFPDSRLQGVLQTTSTPVSPMTGDVALVELRLESAAAPVGGARGPVALRSAPAVTIAELRADAAAFAAVGNGFDAGWRKRFEGY